MDEIFNPDLLIGEWFKAAQRGDTAFVVNHLNHGMDVNAGDPINSTALMMAVWGGHKGSGLAIAIQLLGAMAGAPAHTGNTEGWGLLVIAMDPEMFRPIAEFKREVDAYSETIRSSQPLKGNGPIRMPFDRSWEIRQRTREGGFVHVEKSVLDGLQKLVDGAE